MKQIQRASAIGSAGTRPEPLAIDPRHPAIVRAHRIARRGSRPGARLPRSGRHPAAPVPGR